MPKRTPERVTLTTLDTDLKAGFADLKQEVRTGFADVKTETRAGFADLKSEVRDLKVTLVAGFAGLPTRESSEEMVRLLRESNRLQEERFTQLDVRMREQHLETQQVLHALAEGQRVLTDQVRILAGGIQGLAGVIQGLAADIKTLVARLDALIKGRGRFTSFRGSRNDSSKRWIFASASTTRSYRLRITAASTTVCGRPRPSLWR